MDYIADYIHEVTMIAISSGVTTAEGKTIEVIVGLSLKEKLVENR